MLRIPVTSILRAARTVVAGLLAAPLLLLTGAEGAAAAGTATPCVAAARACVDLSSQQAWLTHDGNVTYGPVRVASGRASAPTDVGTFQVFLKDRDHRSSLFDDAPMPYSVFYNGDEAFHQGSLGSRSHGCVRLARSAAQTFYNTLQVGDTVQVVR
ncbi:MAG: L,D-transpeptidase [Actinomycetota bacterium]|nr:L,D-transpeptidase [Actinomycetota bacterium]